MPEAVCCRLFRTTAELEAFVPEWRALWREDPRATPFQSPEWLLPWWHHFPQPELRALAILKGGRAIGFLPLHVYCKPGSDERQLLLLGVSTSDYLDGIFSGACTVQHVQAGLRELRSAGGWDVLSVQQMREDSLLFRALREMDDGPVQQFPSDSCSRVAALAMGELPVKIRRNAMYYRNRARRHGELLLTTADQSTWERSFELLRQLHTEWWESRGEPGVLANEQVVGWHREALPQLQESGMLRLGLLQLNGEAIGVLYSLVDPAWRAERVQYVYLPGHSLKYADLRPGTLLLAYASEQAAAEGVKTIDMLRGNETYKKLWHAEEFATHGIRWAPAARARRTAV